MRQAQWGWSYSITGRDTGEAAIEGFHCALVAPFFGQQLEMPQRIFVSGVEVHRLLKTFLSVGQFAGGILDDAHQTHRRGSWTVLFQVSRTEGSRVAEPAGVRSLLGRGEEVLNGAGFERNGASHR